MVNMISWCPESVNNIGEVYPNDEEKKNWSWNVESSE